VEQHLLESGQELRTHSQEACWGQWCAIHKPMPGPWADWPRVWSTTLQVLYRICPCHAWHPVAEMYAYTLAMGEAAKLWHPCCDIHPCTPIDGGYE
jgi:hypothetical protein